MNWRALLGGLSLATLSLATARAQSALGNSAPPAPIPASAVQAPKLDDTVAQNFNRIVLARWGDAVLPNAPPFNPNALTGDQAQHAISL